MNEKGTIYLGKSEGRKINFPLEQRKKHTHIVGGTGTGKSNFIFNCIIQDIQQGNGLTLIDPHGEFFDRILNWLGKNKAVAGQRKIRIIDTTEDQLIFGFNPLKHTVGDVSTTASYNLSALTHVWGEDSTQTPRMREVLQNVFISLASQNLTYLEADLFFNLTLREKRKEFIKDLPNRDYWEDLNVTSNREYREEIASARRRVNDLILTKKMKYILGQTENTFDAFDSMENEEIVLVNLARTPNLEQEQSRMLGCLMINQYFNKAFQRTPSKAKPHFLYVDEVQNYLTGDIEAILSECRKFGLHMVIAHQHLGQIKEYGDKIYNGIMSQAENKIVFGELSYNDGIELAQHIFKTINFKEIKHAQKTPTVVGHRKELMKSFNKTSTKGKTKTSGQATSRGETAGKGNSSASGDGAATALNFIPDEHGNMTGEVGMTEISNESNMLGTSEYTADSFAEVFSNAMAQTETEGITTGATETLVPIIKDYVTSVQFYSLPEQHHRNNERLRTQAIGEAFVSLQGQHLPSKIKIPYELTDKVQVQKNQLLKKCFQKTPFIQTYQTAEKIVKERELNINEKTQQKPIDDLKDEDFLG